MSDPFTDTLAEVLGAARGGRAVLGRRGVRLDTARLVGLLDLLVVHGACAVRAIRSYEHRRGEEGEAPLGPLPEGEALLSAVEALRVFLWKRRADIVSLGHGTVVSGRRLDELVARLEQLGEPYARQLRDYRALFPDVDQQAMFLQVETPATRRA